MKFGVQGHVIYQKNRVEEADRMVNIYFYFFQHLAPFLPKTRFFAIYIGGSLTLKFVRVHIL